MELTVRGADVSCVALRVANPGVLTRLQSALKAQGVSAEWTPREQLHCTLLTSDVVDDDVAKRLLPGLALPLAFSTEGVKVEAWGDYLVLVLDARPALLRIQTDIFNRGLGLGLDISDFTPPSVYKPHVTLGSYPRGSLDGLDGFPTDPLYFDELVVWNGDYRVVDAARLPKEAGDRLFVEVGGLTRRLVARGGPGSGHFGHEGRPGEVGGSQPGDFHSARPDSRRFQRGSGVYPCKICGKMTRATGQSEEGVELCAYCFEEAGLENSLADGYITEEQYNAQLAQLRKRYDRDEQGKPIDKPPVEKKPRKPKPKLPPLENIEHGGYFFGHAADGKGGISATEHGDITEGSRRIGYMAGWPKTYYTLARIRPSAKGGFNLTLEYGYDKWSGGYYDTLPQAAEAGANWLAATRNGKSPKEAVDDLVTRGGPGSGHFGHAGRPGEVGGSLPDGVRIEKLGGEDIAIANPDGTISVDPDKFFGHPPETQAEILAHERAHFLEAKIPPEVKATLFDDGVVSAYRGKNINEKLANMIADEKLPAYLQAYIDAGDFHSAPDQPVTFKGFHTTFDNPLRFAQRGNGYYIALDRPFFQGPGKYERVSIRLKPSEILDPRDLLSEFGTDVEKSRAAWDEVYDRANDMKTGAHDWMDDHIGYKELGYRAEVGEIEPGHPEHGRELVVWYPEDVEHGEAVSEDEASQLAKDWYASAQAPDFHYAPPSKKFVVGGRWNPDADLLYHWTDRDGLDGILDRLTWHAGSMTRNPAYRFDRLNKARFALVFDASKVKQLPAEKQVPWEEWEVVSKKDIDINPADSEDTAFLGFGVRTQRDKAVLQNAITKIYDEDWADMWPIHLVPGRTPKGLVERAAPLSDDRPPRKEPKKTADWRTGKRLPDVEVDRASMYLTLDLPPEFVVADVETPTDWKPEISNPLDGDMATLTRWLAYNLRAYHEPEAWDLRDLGERAGVINRIPTPAMRERIDWLDAVGSELERTTLGPQMVALSEAVTAMFGGEPIPRHMLVQGDPDATIEVLAKGKTISGVLGQMSLNEWTALGDAEKRALLGEYYMVEAGLETGGLSSMLPDVVRVMYSDTQDVLARQGFEKDSTLRLYRGLVERPSDILPADMDGGWVNVEISNLSPWTFSPGVAAEYATRQSGRGSLMAMDVPAGMVFCNWETGPASRRWLSYLLMASRDPMKAYLFPVQRARLRHG